MRRIVTAMMVMGLLMALMATPAFAFHHTALPVADCAANEDASNNPTAKSQLTEQGLFPPRIAPVGTAGETVTSATPAEQNCPPLVP